MRHIDYSRVALVVLACVAAVAAIGYLAPWTARISHDWLAQQQHYQRSFDEIELVNKPPPWFEGGAQKFLEGARLGAREPNEVSVLDVTPEYLTSVFKKYAWVEHVVRADKVSGRIRVELRYRQPVAWVPLRDARQLMIDHEGTILPTENVDVSALGTLLPRIEGRYLLAPPVSIKYGEKWKSRSGPQGLEAVDQRIVAAASLAGFLMDEPQKSDAARSPALHMRLILVTDFESRGLFVFNDEDAAILWGDAPGAEKPGKLTASDKWAILKRWEQSTPARLLDTGDYWDFSRKGLVYFCPPQHTPRHQPRTASERPRPPHDSNPKSEKSG